MRLYCPLYFALAAFSLNAVAAPVHEQHATRESAWTQIDSGAGLAARHESSTALVGETLYVMGGRGDRALQAMDLKTRQWKTLAAPPIEIHHAQAIAHDGLIYVVAGLTGPFPEESPLDHVFVYDPKTDAWSKGAEVPKARRRGAAGVAVIDGLVYIIGGNTRGHNSGYVPWVDSLDLATGRWTVLADAPNARDHFHAAVVDGRIYAAGGRLSAADAGAPLSRTIAEVDVFDPSRGSWSTLSSDLPSPRAGTTAVQLDGELVVLGGESDRQVPAHAEVEAYSPRTRQWRRLPDMPGGRHGAQAVERDGDIIVAAGSANRGGGPELGEVVCFSAAKGCRWE